MMAQLENSIATDLRAGQLCSMFEMNRKYSMVPLGELRQVVTQLYQQDKGNHYDLLCHIVATREGQLRSQLQLFSHIQAGHLLDHKHQQQSTPLSQWKINQFTVLAILPKDMPFEDATQHLGFEPKPKSREYHNKYLQPPKIKMCATSSRDQIKSKQQKPKSVLTQPKKEEKYQPKLEATKNVSQNTKKNEEPLKQSALRPRKETPVVTELESVKQKVEEERMIKPPTRGMQIESDEEYYDKEKFNQAMGVEDKGRQTDGSGKKSEKMEVEADERVKDRKFIAESEDEEQDEEFFNQLQQTKKVEPQPTPKPAISKPTLQPSQQSNNSSKPKPMVTMKGGLTSWLKSSK